MESQHERSNVKYEQRCCNGQFFADKQTSEQVDQKFFKNYQLLRKDI